MSESAQPAIASARCAAGLAAVLATGVLAGQEPPPIDWSGVDAIAVEGLSSDDPSLRGESALWLASRDLVNHYPAILEVARDSAPIARARGIVAIGLLAPPGGEAFLGATLERARSTDPDGWLAALALGLMRDDRPAPAIDRYLDRLRGGSFRRHRNTLGSLLLGLGASPHQSRRLAIRELLEDEANREESLHGLARAAIDRIVPPSQGEASRAIRARYPTSRLWGLSRWQQEWRPDDDDRAVVRRLAYRDRQPSIRAAALELMARWLSTDAIPLAERALASSDPVEAAAGGRSCVRLLGKPGRQQLERRIRVTSGPLQAALLRAHPGPFPPELQLAGYDLSGDADQPFANRVAAALLLHRAGSSLAPPRLRQLFTSGDDGVLLAEIGRELHQLGWLDRIVETISPPSTPEDADRLPGRARALATIGHPAAGKILVDGIDVARIPLHLQSRVLAGLRVAIGPRLDPDLLAAVPAAVADVLR